MKRKVYTVFRYDEFYGATANPSYKCDDEGNGYDGFRVEYYGELTKYELENLCEGDISEEEFSNQTELFQVE